MASITVYSTRFCPYCTAAKNLLSAKGAEYNEIAVDSDPQLRLEIAERSGQRTVPPIWINDAHIGGYSELAALETSGALDSLLSP
jgi:glutaredoxin 3